MKLQHVLKSTADILSRNSPTILTGVAVAGMVTTVVLAVSATPEAMRRLDMHREVKNAKDEVFGPKEVFLATWKLYIPAAAVGGVTVACIIGANSISSKRNAALLGLYTLTDTAFSEYKTKVVEVIGDKAEEKIRQAVVQDKIERDEGTREVIITGNGDVTCYDSFTGRYFKSNMELIRKAQNDINLKCINEMYASQNDFYNLIGLPSANTGEMFGWTTDNPLELNFTAALSPTGEPYMSIGYSKPPVQHYYKGHR